MAWRLVYSSENVNTKKSSTLKEAIEALEQAQNNHTMYILGQLKLAPGITVEKLEAKVIQYQELVKDLLGNTGNFD